MALACCSRDEKNLAEETKGGRKVHWASKHHNELRGSGLLGESMSQIAHRWWRVVLTVTGCEILWHWREVCLLHHRAFRHRPRRSSWIDWWEHHWSKWQIKFEDRKLTCRRSVLSLAPLTQGNMKILRVSMTSWLSGISTAPFTVYTMFPDFLDL